MTFEGIATFTMEIPKGKPGSLGSHVERSEKSRGRLERIVEEPLSDTNTTVVSRQRCSSDPIMPGLQAAPLRWLEGHFPQKRQRTLLYLSICLIWALTFAVLSDQSMALTMVDRAYQPVRQLSCTDSLWLPGNGCGINGENCPVTSKPFAFYCPANCANVRLQEPHMVGSQEIVNQPLAIGGPIYRADSWICASAVHFGIVDNSKGGCGVVSPMGQTNTFPGSRMNGIASIAVKTYFPQSFKFQFDSEFECHGKDQSQILPYISIAFTAIIFLFNNNPLLPFCTALGVGFLHAKALLDVGNTEGAVVQSSSHNAFQTLTTVAVQHTPVLLCSILIYRHLARRTLNKFNAPMEKTVLWLGAFWFGLHIRHDLHQKIFAIPILVSLIAFNQVYYLRQEGTLSKWLPLYAVLLFATVVSLVFRGVPSHLLPLVLLLLPGAAILTRPNLAYQGLLVGLVVQGFALYGLLYPANLFSTSTSAVDLSQFAGIATPEVLEPVIHINDASSNITFTWHKPVPAEVDGISMLVNDVERARHSFASQESDNFEWVRSPQAVPDFVRFSWIKGTEILGYGDAGVWKTNGIWTGLGRGEA